MNSSEAEGARWWAHLRQRPDRAAGSPRGLWPLSPGIGLRATRPPGPLDEIGPEPPVMGVLAFSDEQLNRRAESFGVTERSLGWLRAWGERFGELAFEVVEFVLDRRTGAVASDGAALLADVDRLLAGRLDDAWLEDEQRATAPAEGGDIITVLRMLGLCQAAARVGANPAEIVALAAAVACWDAFRRDLHAALLLDRTLAIAEQERAVDPSADAGRRAFALVTDEVKVIADGEHAARPISRR